MAASEVERPLAGRDGVADRPADRPGDRVPPPARPRCSTSTERRPIGSAGRTSVIDHEHASRYTADMFIAPSSVVGFFPAYHHFAIPWHDHEFYELGIVESGSGLHVGPSGSEPFRRGTVVLVPPGAGARVPQLCRDAGPQLLLPGGAGRARARLGIPGPGAAPAVQPDRRDRPQGRPSGRRAPARRARAASHARGPGGRSARCRPNVAPGPQSWSACLSRSTASRRATRPGRRQCTERPATSQLVAQACELLEHDLTAPVDARRAERTPLRRAVPSRAPVRSMRRHAPDALPRKLASRACRRAAGRRQTSPVAAIGAAVGWPDPSQFSRRFRAEFGVSPRAYRQRVRPTWPVLAAMRA